MTHHLFYDAGIIEYYGVTTFISDVGFASDFITYARICIAGFAFLSAFGITRTLKAKMQLTSAVGKNSKLYTKTVFRRIVKLESGAWFVFAYISYIYLSRIPVLCHVLKFIGEHATNIFLIHTLIYYYFYSDFIYSFGYSWAIVLALLIISLIVSMIIELLKKITGYNWIVNKVVAKIELL